MRHTMIIFTIVLMLTGLSPSKGIAKTNFADGFSSAHSLDPLSAGTTSYTGTLQTSGGGSQFDEDYFSFTVPSAGKITVYSSSPSNNDNLDAMGYLYDGASSSNFIASNDDGGEKRNFKIKRTISASQAGTYYIMVRGYYKNWNIGDYILNIQYQPDASAYYRDRDGDGFGDPYTTQSSSGQGWVTNSDDCNDNDASINPNADDNQCDDVDNDCDGEIDEDAAEKTFYEDSDGDGYGKTDTTTQACKPPSPSWVATPGDCNDSNPAIHPGATDICEDNIDQDCSGQDRPCTDSMICIDIADAPLTTQIKSAPPLIMFVLDNSGSMDFDILCNTQSGQFEYGNGASSAYINTDSNIGLNSYADDVRKYWKTQWHQHNKLYYDPSVTYTPWPNLADAPVNTTRKHPILNYGTKDMDSDLFARIAGVDIRYAHYYASINSTIYLVNLDQGTTRYYQVTAYSSGAIESFTALNSSNVPASLRISSYDTALQNMANWYQYCRNRELAAKSAVARVIDNVTGMKIGFHFINARSNVDSSPVQPIHIDGEDKSAEILTNLYKLSSKDGTPLRKGLYNVGQYFDNNSSATGGIGASPFASEADGGTCQQAFAIVMTDGYYNGDFNSVGNTDKNSSDSPWDGPPYEDNSSNTLADIAMHFYETDLDKNLTDNVPTSDKDAATHQHMVTYTVAFGVTGSLNPNDYDCPDNCPGGSGNPAWPNPYNSNTHKIDDMFHAAVNGRGQFLSAGDSQALANALIMLMESIATRTSNGASVTLNSQKLEQGSLLFKGFFHSGNWMGDLKAYTIIETKDPNNPSVPPVITTTEKWSAQAIIKAKESTWWNSGRNILTLSDKSTVPFRHTSLNATQQALLSENVVNYIRGDDTHEKGNGQGTYRNRGGYLLGDIVNASPVFENETVYVGANDGMLHAFDSDTGQERYAYIPTFVHNNLPSLTAIDYNHKYFVDNTVYIRTIETENTETTWLVGGLGKGGKGYYGIDITNPTDISEDVGKRPTIWEYPTQENPDNDMGYSYSMPAMVLTNTGERVILVGNGYDSNGAKAVLIILKTDGTLLKKIDTLSGSPLPADDTCNGLSTPVPVDSDGNNTVDIVYAGDLLGNLWKFDLSGNEVNSWGVAYDGNPIFTAKNRTGGRQPITSRPAVMTHCDPTRKGNIIVFGTGRYLSFADTSTTETQSIYGIWDWENEGTDVTKKHLGTFGPGSTETAKRDLSNINEATLLKQYVTTDTGGLIKTSSEKIHWYNPDDKNPPDTQHVGWYMDLPQTGERVVSKTQLLDGNALLVSIVPKNTPCKAGGGSAVFIMNACSGAMPDDPLFDTNDDRQVTDDDGKNTGKRYDDDIYFAPAIVNNPEESSDMAFFDDEEQLYIKKEALGLIYWRLVR